METGRNDGWITRWKQTKGAVLWRIEANERWKDRYELVSLSGTSQPTSTEISPRKIISRKDTALSSLSHVVVDDLLIVLRHWLQDVIRLTFSLTRRFEQRFSICFFFVRFWNVGTLELFVRKLFQLIFTSGESDYETFLSIKEQIFHWCRNLSSDLLLVVK